MKTKNEIITIKISDNYKKGSAKRRFCRLIVIFFIFFLYINRDFFSKVCMLSNRFMHKTITLIIIPHVRQEVIFLSMCIA